MIVEMSRVLVLGPKRLLGQVIDEVQRLGTLHVDRIESEEAPEVSALQLAEEDAKTVAVLERVLTRADGLLALLPPGSAEPGDAPGDASVDALDAEVAALERRGWATPAGTTPARPRRAAEPAPRPRGALHPLRWVAPADPPSALSRPVPP